MSRLGRTLELLAGSLVALTGQASASPPPPRIEVIAYSDDRHEEALADAYISFVARSGAFDRAPISLENTALRSCAGRETEACIRKSLQGRKRTGATVVVIAESAGPGKQRWTCVGVGGSPFAAQKQVATFDLREAFFGKPDARFQQTLLAMGCIMSAAAESGW